MAKRGKRPPTARPRSAADAPREPAAREWLAVALGLALAVGGVYGPVVGHEFVNLDDAAHFVHNPNLDGRLGFDDVRGAFRMYLANWMPLSWISIAIDNALYGVDPTGPLVTNAVLHAISSVLLLLALLRLTRSLGVSAFVAAVFAVHPLHVESVAWASQRKDVLMGVGWTAAMLAYALYRERRTAGRYLALLASAVFALLAKPVAVTLPFALLLLDVWPLRRIDLRWGRFPKLLEALVEKLPIFALAAVTSALTVVAQTSEGADTSVQLSLPYRLLNAGHAYMAYGIDAFWPSGLAAYYPYHADALLGPAVIGSCAGILLLTALAVRFAGAKPHLWVGWLWFLGTLVPMIGLVHVGSQARADRYMYLPLIGLALAVGWEARAWAVGRPGLRRPLAVAGVAAVLLLAIAAHRQVRHWRDSETLFAHAVAVTRDNAFAHTALGAAYRERGDLERAERHLEQALRIRPESGDARSDLGLVRIDQGRLGEARALLERALATGADTAKVRAALGVAAERSGDLAAAIASYRESLRANPQRVDAANNLAWILATAPDAGLRAPAEAIALALRVARWNPHDPSVLDTLAAAYAAAGRYDDAAATQARALAALGPGAAALRADLERRLEQYEAQRRSPD